MQSAGYQFTRKMMALLSLYMAIVLFPAPVMAEATYLTPCISPVRVGDSVAELRGDRGRFDCARPQSELSPGDYWVRMDVPAHAQQQDIRPILRMSSLWDNGFSLTAVHSDGSITEYSHQRMAKLAAMRLGPSIMIPLDSRKPPIATLIARVENSQIILGVLENPVISDPGDAMSVEMAHGTLYAAFGGLCIAMLVYTIVLWRAMRQRFLLAYCVMVITMAVYAYVSTGAVHYLVDGLTGGDRIRLSVPLLSLFAGTALIFVRYFFPVAIVPKWLVRATYLQVAFMNVVGLTYALIAPNYIGTIDLIYRMSFVTIPMFVLVYAWTAWRQKDPFLKFFLLAWSAPVMSVVVRTLYGTGWLPHHILIENSTIIAYAVEGLVNSLAVGSRIWMLAQARDRAEMSEASAMQMADTDPLTGLLNRRAFLRSMLERQNHWTLVLLDIDHFKRVNDSLGHAGGDDAITRIACVMLDHAPDGALVARMGGEEFAIAYRSVSNDAFDVDRLLADVRTITLPEGYRMTASVGAANRQVNDENDWKILYRAADMALYQAKSAGRDCFIRFNDERAAA